ncbi:hypothetical protein DMENIID0001_126220 [Sergentomyia squamirostris]
MGKVKKNSGKISENDRKTQKQTDKSTGVLNSSVRIKKKSKREKFSQKRKNLRLKIASKSLSGDSTKKNKRRRKKVKSQTLGDVTTLKDALPSLESLIKFRSVPIKTGVPEYDNGKKEPSNRSKRLSRKAQKIKGIAASNSKRVARIKQLENLMQDRMFQQNPRQIIAEHIKNTRKLEDEMDI